MLPCDHPITYDSRRVQTCASAMLASNRAVAQFTASALTDIHAATDGIPRLINILCDNALLVGYAKEVHCIDSPIIAEVVRDMTCWGLRVPSPAPQAAPAGRQE